MSEVIEEFLLARGIEYIVLDGELRILRTSARAAAWFAPPELGQSGEDIRAGFPELVGAEDCLAAVARGESQRFELKAIARMQAEGTPIYLDLQVVCPRNPSATSQLLLTLEDVSDRLNLEQTLVQSTNEMGLVMASLEASHNYIQKIIESIADALFVVRTDGAIESVNRAAREWFGYSEAELAGREITRIITDENFFLKELHEALVARSDALKKLEVTCSTQNGQQRLVAFSCSAIAADRHNGCKFLYIGRDITDSRQAQRRATAQYRIAQILSTATSVDLALPPILQILGEHLDWLSGTLWLAEAEIAAQLQPAARWWSRSAGERARQFQLEHRPESERLAYQAWQSGRFEEGLDLPSGLAIPIKSGQAIYGAIVFLSETAQVVGKNSLQILDTVATNLGQFLQRKRAEADLAESEERYRDLFENASDLIWSMDCQGKFLYANRAFQQALGYSWEQLQQKSMFELLPPAEKIEFAKNFSQVLRGQRLELMQMMLVTAECKRIALEGSINSKQEEGKAIATRAMFRDITQRLAIESALHEQRQQAERLLLNILPARIAAKLKESNRTIAEKFEDATVLFADIANFTHIAETLSAIEVVDLLNRIFSKFDRLAELHGLEKIKTIGDAYMVVGGVPELKPNNLDAVANFALDIREAITGLNRQRAAKLSLRIGIHTGPVVAGVIGLKKFIYDLWGDTVNIASRMESHGIADRIQVTAIVEERLRSRYNFQERGAIDIKGKGLMETYWLLDKK